MSSGENSGLVVPALRQGRLCRSRGLLCPACVDKALDLSLRPSLDHIFRSEWKCLDRVTANRAKPPKYSSPLRRQGSRAFGFSCDSRETQAHNPGVCLVACKSKEEALDPCLRRGVELMGNRARELLRGLSNHSVQATRCDQETVPAQSDGMRKKPLLIPAKAVAR